MKRAVALTTVLTVLFMLFGALQIGASTSDMTMYGGMAEQEAELASSGIITYDLITHTETYSYPPVSVAEEPLNGYGIEPAYTPDAVSGSNGGIGTCALIGDLDENGNPIDDRDIVQNVSVSPYTKVVYLKLIFSDGYITHGTGFILGPDLVMTSCHLVYMTNHGGYVDEIEVYTEVNGSLSTNPASKSIKLTIPTYGKNGQYDYDWAYFVTADPIGHDQGWFGFGYAATEGTAISVTGYPNMYMYTESGTLILDSSNSNICYYDVDTTGGQSGSPIYDSGQIVWGVHKGGYNGTHNVGIRIAPYLFNYLQSAKQEGIDKWG